MESLVVTVIFKNYFEDLLTNVTVESLMFKLHLCRLFTNLWLNNVKRKGEEILIFVKTGKNVQ